MNIQALRRDLANAYVDSIAVRSRENSISIATCNGFQDIIPSQHVLRMIGHTCLDCFVPKLFADHMAMVRKIDGAGLRMDAEFKLGKHLVVTKTLASGKQVVERPYRCCIAVRGVRGLYLDVLKPQKTHETGEAYQEVMKPIAAQRKALCADTSCTGLLDFIVFDNGPAYELYALAAVGHVWPEHLFGAPEPPRASSVNSRLHPSLRRDVIPVVSDPPHRRWHWQK